MRKSVIIISIIFIIIVGSLFFLQYKFKSTIINAIENEVPQNIQIKYSQIHVNAVLGNIKIDSFSVKLLNSEKHIVSKLNAKNLSVIGFNLASFIINNKVSIKNIRLKNPQLQYFNDKTAKIKQDNSNQKKTSHNSLKEIKVDEISVINGFLKIHQNKQDSIYAKIDNINFSLNEFCTSTIKLKEKIPFTYKDFKLKSQHLFLNMSNYEDLKIDDLAFENNKLILKNLYIAPKFSKEVLSTKIAVERDHIQLHIPQSEFNKLDIGCSQKKFFVILDSGKITKPNLMIYRDKRVADDLEIKNLYSKMLRDLSFELDVAKLKIEQGYVSYSEQLEDADKAGKVFFDAINASITNLSNINKNNEKTEFSANSNFMGKAPMVLDISFDVTNKQDAFLGSGEFKNFNAKIASDFFESNLNAKATGEFEQIYFTFSGNNLNSEGDLKMKYENFEFKILNNKNEVNKFLTAIGNLFIKDNSKADKNGFRYGKIKVERNKNKSFFNYLWINVEDGIKSTLTGNGKKKM
ncbi:hypothetical protein [Lutibacter maritimus]|uniref:AsmA-like C-terminal region n=1 Tax=Lutibacter maritimus TaxID=593133 RepID=A0A1I6R5C2_9FLAO|nr:hypothetical protein [Lutibacter maritimus]SFS59885.1 hypothetical protein SAMN04488006_2231 [Lutibacter maritimus]